MSATNPTPTQKARATTRARAVMLFTSQGYACEAYADRPCVFAVSRPDNDPRTLRKGDSLWNDVDVAAQTCTCGAFGALGECCHLIAVNAKLAEETPVEAPTAAAPTSFAARFAAMSPAEKSAQMRADFGG